MPQPSTSLQHSPRPQWLTFDCYGTLIQWDEGLRDAVTRILQSKPGHNIGTSDLIATFDHHEHALEQTPPHRAFREVAGEGLRLALQDLGLAASPQDIGVLTDNISAMPPFPEVVPTLAALKARGYRLCIVSNTDDDIIAGNVAQLGGHIDRVITAQQAAAYKPNRRLFDYAHQQLGVTKDDVVHICASPHLDHAAARDIGFRCVWVDRGTGRRPLPDYTPDATIATLDTVVPLLDGFGW
ncbi:haloacid dehalogenase type II [Pandoraea commovens]|uniref:Haloacid dehalogenase type II n=1 Tax=Pandoraea commovens TaxID=2508289 RepID=A0ABY5QH87_9BURK|nr:haloacid dehalogenase type II [Pandoraea commovens]UVA80171.1 haloacid dehalogenase type II [Pandoraea commovens]